jgi:hypothetical protein
MGLFYAFTDGSPDGPVYEIQVVTIQHSLCRGLARCCDSPTLMWLREFDSRLGTARLSLV